MTCPQCGDAGWVIEATPVQGEPVDLQVLPCLLPDCAASGRHIGTLDLAATR